jgi:2-polyprenyl-3-methyl-5-hydroxy-6-metoxy-1,4-benzoquinol methylase
VLKGYTVNLWHIFDNTEDGIRMLPPGEWAVTGGCDAGLRAMTISAFLGFRDLHIFGLDGSAPVDSARHAGEHPNSKAAYSTTEVDGQTFYTTPAMLEAARGTFHELDQLPKVKATFYGEGLTQALAKQYQAKQIDDKGKAFANVVGFVKPTLISAEYRSLNTQLHQQNMAYGVGGGKHADVVIKLVGTMKPPVSVLDYGAGKGMLAKALPFAIWEYDPAIPGKDESPRPADLVVCTDVLEHIEPEHLDAVLLDLKRCVKQLGYFVIDTAAASKTLPDGRNTHLIQRDAQWWRTSLQRVFHIATMKVSGRQVRFLVAPRHEKRSVAHVS